MARPVLAYQARRRALAELDTSLAQAEQDHAAYLALAERLAAAGGDARAAGARARVAGRGSTATRAGREDRERRCWTRLMRPGGGRAGYAPRTREGIGWTMLWPTR